MKTNTREKLIETFRAQILLKDFDKMTVAEICRKANVSHASFYRHFQDKYDLMTCALFEIFEAEGDTSVFLSLHSYEKFLEQNCRKMIETQNQLKRIMNISNGNIFWDGYCKLGISSFQKRIRLHTGNEKIPEKEQIMLYIYVIGSTQFSKKWVESNFPESPQTVAKAMVEAIPSALKKYFD